MFRILNICTLFLVFPFILLGCNDGNNSSLNNVISPQNTNASQHTDNKKQHDHNNKKNHKENTDETETDFSIDIDKLPKSKVLITANQTNAWQQQFNQFDLELVNIKFTVKPDNIDKAIDIYMNKSNAVNTDTDKAISIDLTYLNSNEYLLLHEMAIPSGTITAITLSFSGTNSHIELLTPVPAPPTKTFLVDAFFSSYSKGDDKTHEIRNPPAELFTKTDIKLTQDDYQYINITIDKNMTAGLDPFFTTSGSVKHQYLQFIPVAEISIIEKGTSIPIVITSKTPFNDSNINRSNLVGTVITPDNQPHSDKNYIFIKGILNTDDQPQLDTKTIFTAVFPSSDRLLDYMRGQYSSDSSNISNNQILHLRNTLKPSAYFKSDFTEPNGSSTSVSGFPMVVQENTGDISFYFPDKSEFGFDKRSLDSWDVPFEMIKQVNWQAKNMIINNDATLKISDTDPVESLVLPLDQKGRYTIINTGRVNVNNFAILPDNIQHFDNSTDFYQALKKQVNENLSYTRVTENAIHIVMLDAEGFYVNPNFKVTNAMKVIITGDLNIAFKKWVIGLSTMIGGSLIALGYLPILPKLIPYAKEAIANGTLPIDSLDDFLRGLSHLIEDKFLNTP